MLKRVRRRLRVAGPYSTLLEMTDRVPSFLVLLWPLTLACGATETTAPNPIRSGDPASTTADVPLVIENVSVLPMTSETRLDQRTVHVRNGVIEWLGSADAEPARPVNATVIHGGIGTVRNMWGHFDVRRLRDEIASGSRFGPTIITLSPGRAIRRWSRQP
jgi:hypothetical protein